MTRAAPSELLALAGLPPAAAERIAIAGGDPVFPPGFRVGTGGAAAIGAAAIAAAELWALRSGRRPQAVAVDLRHAAAALRSYSYLRIDGAPPKPPFDPVSGLYRARDG